MNISDPSFRLEKQIKLPEDEVHLWRVDLARVAHEEEKWKQVLSEDERKRAARFHFARDCQNFTATRALLRTVLGSYTACDPSHLVFCYSDKEKPSLSPDHLGDRIEFNVSHSGTIALLAFSRGRMLGVDVEQIREDLEHEALARRFFSPHEQQQLAAAPENDRIHAFFRCWTRKEAYIKATGIGLSLPLRDFDVSLVPGDENAMLSTRPDAREAARWSLREVPTDEGYVAALCVEGHGWRLQS